MRRVVASTPGKLILMGEHAAVYGHPAVVSTIDLRLRVTLQERPGGGIHLELPDLCHRETVEWPAVLERTRRSRADWEESLAEDGPQGIRHRSTGHQTPGGLVLLALGEVAERLGRRHLPGLDLEVSSEIPLGAGFGSSAAVAVATTAAFLAFLGESPTLESVRELSFEVERRQHGTPSGVDNTAVLEGGLLWATREDGRLVCRTFAGCPGILSRFRVYHSGAPAESTGVAVAAVRRLRGVRPDHCRKALGCIDRATRAFHDLLTAASSPPETAVTLLRDCEAGLEALGVVPEPVRRVFRGIEEAGGAAKVSGAGALTGEAAGSVLLYHPEPERLEALRLPASWSPLGVRLGGQGLRLEQVP